MIKGFDMQLFCCAGAVWNYTELTSFRLYWEFDPWKTDGANKVLVCTDNIVS